jgi:hypothetical protein
MVNPFHVGVPECSLDYVRHQHQASMVFDGSLRWQLIPGRV